MEATSINENSIKEFGKNRNSAALQVQKTYKSFRTRRQLADCAVLVEQRWWKLLDFAELKCSSISFFAIEKPETAISRWSRARTRAAKVGKGLSKDDKARQLALQHWLEAIDPRHRYGHNLQFYYVKWLQCDSKQPFFYWLDVGEGKEVNLERCPRSKLQHQCIKYLGPAERKMYEVVIEDGKFIYAKSRKYVDTFKEGTEDVKWIFVLSASKTLYVGRKKKGTFQHSSFLAGGATLSAGRLIVEQGVLKAVWPHSGHYLPTEENFEEFMSFLVRHKVNLSVVQRTSNNEDEVSFGLRNSISAPDLNNDDPSRQYSNNDAQNINPNISRWSRKLHSKIGPLQIPAKDDCWGYDSAMFKTPHQEPASNSDSDGYETPEEFLSDSEFSVSKQNLFEYQESIPKEKIMKRINSHKGMRSYQLGDQLSCKWTTGAGPRIGCVRDYPKELQFLVLEDVHFSPRKPFSSPKGSLAALVSS